jgi:hypothetical protein
MVGTPRKNQGRAGLALMALCLFSLVAVPAQAQSSTLNSDKADLDQILEKTSAYCERVKQIALYYVCKEKISDKENHFSRITTASGMVREARAYSIRSTETQTFTYDYQLVKKDEEIKEQRILLEENGKERREENAELKAIKYFSQYLVFGPVGFLSSAWQENFQYEILGEELLGDEQTVILKATPTEEREENYNIGRIWVGDDFQILRVEWEPASIQNYEDETFDSRLGEFKKSVVWTVDYGMEKNGVRFPSRQVIREVFIAKPPRGSEYRAVKHETIFEYVDYKFFIVETDIKYDLGRPIQ